MSCKAGLYIHIPFCIRKCPYCDFYSISDLSMASVFVDALAAEMPMRKNADFEGLEFDSVYLGGGTPTVLDTRSIARILETARATFPVQENAEITIEANPATVTQRHLKEFRRAGVNRINIGIQSFDDANLSFLGRLHSASEGVNAFRMAEKSGFQNIGVDLMYALPGQKPEDWQKDLEKAVSCGPAHISCYMLTFEPETEMDNARKAGKFDAPEDHEQGALFLMTSRMLGESGYDHYEISNFAKTTALQSLHNTGYWRNRPYLGLGPGAHSYAPPVRWWNISSVRRYVRRIQAGRLPVESSERLDVRQQMMEAVYLGLRQAGGIRYDAFNSRFQTDFQARFSGVVARFAEENQLVADNDGCRLTLNGMLMQESIAAAFIDRL